MELTWKRVLCQPGGVEWMLPWMPLILLMIAGPADGATIALELVAIPAVAVALYRDARKRRRRSLRSLAFEGAVWVTAFAVCALLLPSGAADWALFALALALWAWVARAGRTDGETAA